MDFEPYAEYEDGEFSDSPNFRDIIGKYLIHIKWFVLSMAIIVISTFFYLRIIAPEFEINATLLIKNIEKGSSFKDLSSFDNMGLFTSGDNSLENEIQLLKSRNLMTKVVSELKLSFKYFIEDSPYNKEIYPNSPVFIQIGADSLILNKINTSFELLVKSNEQYDLIDFSGLSIVNCNFGKEYSVDFGSELNSNTLPINIELNDEYINTLIGKKVIIQIRPLDKVVSDYMNALKIDPISDNVSNVLKISLKETVVSKGVAIINNLIQQYNADGISDGKSLAQTTTDFLDQRLDLISTELVAIESTAEQFKTLNRMVDGDRGADIYLQSSSSNESDLVQANTQIQLVDYMLKILGESGGELLPANVGLAEEGISSLINEYNNLVLKRKRIFNSSSIQNPIIINIDSQLDVLKNNLFGILRNLKSSIEIQIAAINAQSSRINSRIASVPKNERQFKEIVREQETKNALYLFLLQKRQESILANAVNVDKAKIVDEAYSNGLPVSPKKKIVLMASILIGFLIPFGVIYLRELLDTKVHNHSDIRKLRIPYLGDIPVVLTDKKTPFVTENDNSKMAEAFRYIRTNINYMLDSTKMGKTILVTSTLDNEGKTFTAINLANSLALTGKKTILVAMDLRAPKITKYLNLENVLGVTNFIKNENLTVESIIEKFTHLEKLDIITSGDIPPNPVELLMDDRIDEIFKKLKESYEYIIVDTAPVGLVTDAIQISKNADMTIYVMKANYLDKRFLHIPEKMFKEGKLPNMAILLNGTEEVHRSYGYGYGYGKLKEEPWFKRLLS